MTHLSVRLLSSAEIAFFCEQLRLMINSGVSVYDGLFNIYDEAPKGRMKDVLGRVYETVNANASLNSALKEAGVFPPYMVHMIEVGEQTGRLDSVLESLAVYYDRETHIRAQIRSAVAYPLILFAILAFIMGMLAWKILPIFERMFEELSQDVTITTGASLATGISAGRIAAIVVIVLLVLTGLCVAFSCTRPGRTVMLRVFAAAAPTRRLSALMATARFISSMSLVITSGMDIGAGLEHEAEACQDPTVRRRIEKCISLYADGHSFEEAVCAGGILKGMEGRLLTIAARSGESDATFIRFCGEYDDRVTASLNRLTTVIETVLVVALSLMVGAVLISVMVPLANLIAAVG